MLHDISSPEGLTEIFKTTLAGTSTSIDITNIPASFTHLRLLCSWLPVASQLNVHLTMNADSGSNYEWQGSFIAAASAGSNSSASDTKIVLDAVTTTLRYWFALDIFDYADTSIHKYCVGAGVRPTSASHIVGGRWMSNNAITQITLVPSTSAFAVGSRVALYGVS